MVMRNTDRILVLERIDPKKKEIGLVDPKALVGDNQMHAIMDEATCLWSLRYEHGIVPAQLRDRFTDFKTLKHHADVYFKTRNIKIKEVLD